MLLFQTIYINLYYETLTLYLKEFGLSELLYLIFLQLNIYICMYLNLEQSKEKLFLLFKGIYSSITADASAPVFAALLHEF